MKEATALKECRISVLRVFFLFFFVCFFFCFFLKIENRLLNSTLFHKSGYNFYVLDLCSQDLVKKNTMMTPCPLPLTSLPSNRTTTRYVCRWIMVFRLAGGCRVLCDCKHQGSGPTLYRCEDCEHPRQLVTVSQH